MWAVQALPPAGAARRIAGGNTISPDDMVRRHFGGLPQTPAMSAAAGVFTGAVTLPQAGNGCNLALGSDAPSEPVGQCTVLEIGDSLGNDLAFALSSELPPSSGVRLIRLDKASTGLAKPSYFNWPDQLAEALQTYHPQLVVICLGGNDQQAMADGASLLRFPSAAWQSAYLGRVSELVSEATTSGAYVLWVGMPVMQPPYYNNGMEVLNRLFVEGVTEEPNATFLSTWSLLANPQGDFQAAAQVDGREAVIRSPDGIHFTDVGAGVVATYVVRAMAKIYDVRLVPSAPDTITGWQ